MNKLLQLLSIITGESWKLLHLESKMRLIVINILDMKAITSILETI